jgi:thiol-disulfide isomerase/thioredoxin
MSMFQMHRTLTVGSFIILIGFSVGCGATSVTNSEAKKSDSPESTATIKEENPAIKLVDMSWVELQSLVSRQTGKVVVIDVWSTSCVPCMKEFPHFIELQKKYPDDVVSISFDLENVGHKHKLRSIYRDRALAFLRSQVESHVMHCMCTSAANELFGEINLNSVPAVYVYARNGTLAKRFDVQTSPEGVSYGRHVIPFVDQLIAARSMTNSLDALEDGDVNDHR